MLHAKHKTNKLVFCLGIVGLAPTFHGWLAWLSHSIRRPPIFPASGPKLWVVAIKSAVYGIDTY